MVQLNGTLLAVGGSIGPGRTLASVEAWDEAAGAWTLGTVPDMKEVRDGHAVLTLPGAKQDYCA
jgi:hypothetical protein